MLTGSKAVFANQSCAEICSSLVGRRDGRIKRLELSAEDRCQHVFVITPDAYENCADLHYSDAGISYDTDVL